jgi:chorismate lyase/3-hydroxybenzoate synthase
MRDAGTERVISRAALREPPGWVRRWVHQPDRNGWHDVDRRVAVRAADNGRFALVSVEVRDAVRMEALQLQRATVNAYEHVASMLQERQARYPVRLWNYVPHILDPVGDLSRRYLAFNAGRFCFYAARRQSADDCWRSMVTASGVGHRGDDLVVHCLAATRPGTPVENPRQVPAYEYSRRHGPMPPCFARATQIELRRERSALLVGGTASIRGERSVCRGNLSSQADVTLGNLAALVATAIGEPRASAAAARSACVLARFRSLRVYFVNRDDLPEITRIVEQRFPSAPDVEYVRADLCRPRLLVEIEGVADTTACPTSVPPRSAVEGRTTGPLGVSPVG